MANITGNGALEKLSQGNCHLLHLGCHQSPQLHRPDMISLEQWQGCLQTVKRPILDQEIKGGEKLCSPRFSVLNMGVIVFSTCAVSQIR